VYGAIKEDAAMRTPTKLGKAALAYARKGWPVFPCEARGKKPLTKHGLKDATTDPKKVRTWWSMWPEANIGHPTGEQIVLDEDGPEGKAALAALEKEHGTLPQTLTDSTGKGRHLFFHANGTRIRNSAGKLGPHLDVRGAGGYVILPPSVHTNGKRYEWVRRIKPVPIPAWLEKLVTELGHKPPASKGAGAQIPAGQRHGHLLKFAGRLRAAGCDESTIMAALLAENTSHCNPPKPDSEVRTLAHDVCTRYPAGIPAKNGAEPSGGAISLAKIRTFSSIDPEPLRWLWRGRIPLGKLTVIAGDPGLGKSLLTIDIAARVSTGAVFPDGSPCEVGSVILLSAEDDAADTIRPRLDAAGAYISRVHLLDSVRNVTGDGKSVETSFNLERDTDALEDAIRQTGARLIVIDPISAYLGGTDSHNNSAVRGLLSPLAGLAGNYKVAVVAVTHLRKSAGAAIHRIAESLAFSAAARAAWGVAPDPDDQSRQLFAPIKQNLGRAGGLAYRIEALNDVAYIAWEPGAVAVDVNTVMGGFESREDHSERREAGDWLKDLLADGPRGAADVRNQARVVGLTWITVRRAADSIGIVKRKIGGRGAGWEWALPGECKDAHPCVCDVSTFNHRAERKGDNEHSKVKDAHVSTPEHLCQESTVVETPKTTLSARERAECNPLVQDFLKKFDCRIVEVQDLRATGEIQ
jgi:archaellum biogenesis ATPase FlaH